MTVTAPRPVGLVDMDGTLYDYVGQLRADLAALAAPGEPPCADPFDETKPHLLARARLIKRQPGWWRELPRLQLGWDVVTVARGLDYDLDILTKGPGAADAADPDREPNRRAWREKAERIDGLDHAGGAVVHGLAGLAVVVDAFVPVFAQAFLKRGKRSTLEMAEHPAVEHQLLMEAALL